MKLPSRRAGLLGLVPFGILCFSVGGWDRINPMVLGLPFNLCWMMAGIVMTSLCLALTLRLERDDPPDDPHAP